MSLIQEALKRKENDEARNKPEAGSAEKVPAVSPPADVKLSIARQPAAEVKNTGIPLSSPLQSMLVAEQTPSAVTQSLHRKAALLWVIVAAIVILIGLTVTAGFVFFIYRWLPPVKAKIGQQAYQIGKTAATAAGGTNMVLGQLIPAGGRETADSAKAMPHPSVAPDRLVPKPRSEKDVEKDSIVTAENTPTAAIPQNAVQQQSAGDTKGKPVSVKSGLRQDKPAPARTKTPAESSADVSWPVLKLTGILRGSGPAESTAFINGKMINVGQTIDDVTVLEIQADGVLLKHGAEKRFLRVGATLY